MSGIGIVKPTDLQKISADIEMTKAQQALARNKKIEDEQNELRDQFMARDLKPDVHERVSQMLRHAAENSQREVKVMEFPASFCTDRGRAINNAEKDWPGTLQGWAARGYAFFHEELAPNDYRLRAEIVRYDKDGIPEIVALYLSW